MLGTKFELMAVMMSKEAQVWIFAQALTKVTQAENDKEELM